MPIFDAAAKNAMLNALDIASLSLHLAYDTLGGNEVSGGTPAYARMAVTFGPAAAGQKSMLTAVTFDVPAGVTVQWVGMWSSGSAFQGMEPCGGDGLRPFSMTDPAGNIACPTHGFTVGDSLVVWSGASAKLPAVLNEGTVYYVVAATIDTLQVSTTAGGAAITTAASGSGFAQRIMPTVYTAQGTFPVTSLVLDARAAA